MKTTSATLQAHLERWAEAAANALESQRLLDIVAFVDSFAPLDVNKEDRYVCMFDS